MEKGDSSCLPRGLSGSESNIDKSTSRLSRLLWSEEAEDTFGLDLPSFSSPASFTKDNPFLSEHDVIPKSTQPLLPDAESWNKDLFSSLGSDSQLKSFWDPSQTYTGGQKTTDLFSLDPIGSDKPFYTDDLITKPRNEETYFPNFPSVLGDIKSENSSFLQDQRDTTFKPQNYHPFHNVNSTWDTAQQYLHTNTQTYVGDENNIPGLNTSSPLDQLVARLQQRKVLQDITNQRYSPATLQNVPVPPVFPPPPPPPPFFQAPQRNNFLSSQKTPVQYGVAQHMYNHPEPTVSQPRRQHTDLVALMEELSVVLERGKDNSIQPVFNDATVHASMNLVSPTKCCVFCKNNNYHSTFYKSHQLKDERGHCQCPVLRMYVCPLCNATGDGAHTLKYCPRNTVTRGDPIAAGLPPGKVTNWREVAHKMLGQFNPMIDT